ncbi:hypothetical protein GTU71_00845 [Rathayibacter sp. VKM Ac-2762]|uniref:hypothetical protein n=1 Tax=Rathayibacter sp. VKM Ac-2762 TaxID=2609254 RepID=UPI00132E7CD8|nr:hypothetical protein [Rathayibacter sp. VKM Ac-2762]QHF19546.1 hypothetical protein GTU71_00845 [Rathayibacter sp. VKM Ac-2762]
MFSHSEWAILVSKLRQLTESGKVLWNLEGNTSLSVTVGKTIYRLGARDEDDAPPWALYVIQMSNKYTLEPERLIDTLNGEYGEESDVKPGTLVPGLRDVAYRMALGGPQLAKDLLSEMAAIDPTEPPKYGLPF